MARDAHDATWRACRRFIDVMIANLGTELAATKPDGMSILPPPATGYYVLRSQAAVRTHEANGTTRIYVFPSGDRSYSDRTGGSLTRPSKSTISLSVAIYVAEEVGAPAIEDTWKTLSPPEREFRRCEAILGALVNVVDEHIIDGNDVLIAQPLYSRSGADEFKVNSDDPGCWGRASWSVTQIINRKQQNVQP